MDNIITNENMEHNIKIYKYYKIFAYDVLFYYAISILYMTSVKHFSMAEVMYLSSIFSVFSTLWQVLSNFVIEKIGLKRSIVAGNALCVIMLTTYLLAPSFWIFALGEAFGALGFSLKSISESTILYESLDRLGRKDEFSKFEGSANSKYFYIEAVSAIISGYIFLVNPYIPIILSLSAMVISLLISIKFKHTKNNVVKSVKFKEYIQGFDTVIHSKRTLCILLLAMIINGITNTAGTFYRAILLDFGLTSERLAFVVCAFSFLLGFGAKIGHKIQSITKRHTLEILFFVFTFALDLIAIIGYEFTELKPITMIAVMSLLMIMGTIHGAYRVIIKKYVINFTTDSVRTKITSLYYLVEGLGAALMAFVAGLIIDGVGNNSLACMYVCGGTFVLGLAALIFSRNKLGLKPEQYSPKEIYNVDISKEN